MPYEPRYERFTAGGPDGRSRAIEFVKGGFLASGDQPDLFFFRVDGEEAVVGISGESLRQFQRRRRYLSREEKIDIAGLHLQRQVAAGKPLVSEYLYLRDRELEALTKELGLTT